MSNVYKISFYVVDAENNYKEKHDLSNELNFYLSNLNADISFINIEKEDENNE